MNGWLWILCGVLGYLLGSLNTSVIVSKWKGTDIRQQGSGNAGTTNTLRVMGKGWAGLVLLCDILKAVLAVLLARLIVQSVGTEQQAAFAGFLAGVCAVVGHNFPVFFGFRGGKGIATSLGVVLTVNWKIALLVVLVFAVIVLFTRYVSLASCIGAATLPVFALFLDSHGIGFLILYLLLAVLAIVRHHANIGRLLRGEEHKLGEKKEDAK